MEKVKVGIVGCGGIANSKHLPALKKNKDLNDIVAFCDIIPERAEKAAKEYGTSKARIYTDYKELMADPEVEVVHVCTPNVSHCPITVAAFESGKHVLCEKPMAANSADAGLMIEAWKKSGKKFTIGYQNRFREDVQILKKACENGELGDIYVGKAHAVRRRAVPTWGVFPNKALQGGGPLIDIGTHALDITLWVMDNYDVESVSGAVFYKMRNHPEGNIFGPWNPETFEVEDSAFGFVKMKNGAVVYIEAAWALNTLESKEASTTVCGTLAGAEIHHGPSYPNDELIFNRVRNESFMEERLSPKGGIDYFEGIQSAEGIAENRYWLNAILNDTQPLVKPEEAFVVTQILEAIYQAADQKTTIMF
ncbi:MAG: Gfo/Idh/MocA family oxidoreductase [Clostridiales bacterium]|nr:Gfo/Idh/MocA family oxidoreductase [Clostridiales bacterium]